MWEVIYKSESYKDCPPGTTKQFIGLDQTRLAYWIVKNTQNGVEIPLHLYLPIDPRTTDKAIFSIHGKDRDGHKYRNIFVSHVQDKNVLIIAPTFQKEFFSDSWAFTNGNMYTNRSLEDELPSELWSFSIIDTVFSLLKNDFPKLGRYSLFGHSAGGQFVHRFALFTPKESPLDQAIAVNSGWYTALDTEVSFPYGIKDALSSEQVEIALKRHVTIVAGEDDTLADEHVRMTERAITQGANRYERAQYAYKKAEAMATSLHVPIAWKFISVPGLNHSAKKAAEAAINYL